MSDFPRDFTHSRNLSRNKLAAETSLATEKFLADDIGKYGDDGSSPGANQTKRSTWFHNGQAVDFKIPVIE